jgi:drug/metabolite transporter (DMT)-like permease
MIGGAFAFHWITYFMGIKKSTPSIGILGVSSYGIHLILLGWIFQKNRPGFFDIVALIIALSGTYIIVPEFSLTNDMTIGLLLSVLSGFCFALLPILHQRNQQIPDNLRTFGQFFFAWVIFLFFLPLTHWDLPKTDWWALAYLAVPGTFLTHWLWIRVTTRISTVITSLIFYLAIPLTMLISHVWLKEPMHIQKILGAILIVSGNLLSFYGRARKRKVI